MITVTFIRHGESTDNLRSVWAGWADAPLSNHGMNQAKALGDSFAALRFTAIHASTLKRAHMTAQAVHDAQSEPRPPLTLSPLLREQHFGIAEGKPWSMHMENGWTPEEHFAHGVFPVLTGRDASFPEGESLNDVQARAELAVEGILMPYVRESAKTGFQGAHVAVVSHGLCISELVAAVMRRDARSTGEGNWKGLYNTAWTRVVIEVQGLQPGQVLSETDELPPMKVSVTHVNVRDHLSNVKRQPGGIGSAAFDPKQKDLRSFFGGGGLANVEDGRSESNAHDEVDVEQQ